MRTIALKYLGYSDQYELLEPITHRLSNNKVIKIPIGHLTDMASTPRIFWVIAPPFGKYAYASVVHDYLYMTPEVIVSRRFADAEFRRIMKEDGVNLITRNIFYLFVSLFGSLNWNKYKKFKKRCQ